MRRNCRRLAFALGALGLAACTPPPLRLGPLGDASAELGPLGALPRASLAIAPVLDVRPAIERRGSSAPSSRGNVLREADGASDGAPELLTEGPTTDAAHELALALQTTLRRARLAREPGPGEGPDYTLVVRLERLYVTRYRRGDAPPNAAAPRRPSRVDELGAGLVYGNAGLRVTLVEGRSPAGRPLWTGYVAGAAALRDGDAAAERARREALRGALGRLAWRLGEALDRLGRGPSVYRGPPRSSPPAIFLIERVSRTRTLRETIYVDAAAASVVRHEVSALPEPSYGRPGEWLLSRRTIEGLWLPDGPYEALARSLGPAYELRALDDAERYHFFGPREAPAKASTEPPAKGVR
ncbi:MAG: hypothetical protein MUF34_20925 [Polyangiaceae bacterium]|nr:hypothetical protein [Polyangiaceae bacterium]